MVKEIRGLADQLLSSSMALAVVTRLGTPGCGNDTMRQPPILTNSCSGSLFGLGSQSCCSMRAMPGLVRWLINRQSSAVFPTTKEKQRSYANPVLVRIARCSSIGLHDFMGCMHSALTRMGSDVTSPSGVLCLSSVSSARLLRIALSVSRRCLGFLDSRRYCLRPTSRRLVMPRRIKAP